MSIDSRELVRDRRQRATVNWRRTGDGKKDKTMKLGRATYSPEDNKLRLYPDERLSKEDYERARAHGFKWAPKQELFVAPMWTPEREDLLLEWCEEIEDEDKSLVERAEDRADRFQDYSAARKDDAEAARQAVSAIADNIPLGQPILVGHHSEKRARKDAERIENGMRKAVQCWEQSKYWADRARGAIRHAKYKERPDVRARRIKGLEADKRKQERNKAEANHILRFWRGEFTATNKQTGEKRPFEITEANRERIYEVIGRDNALAYSGYFPGIDGQCRYSAWDVLRPAEERYANCPEMTVEALAEKIIAGTVDMIARYDRWLAHYENRLAYERAMLEADGGTATDRKGPEKGGAVKCWASVRGCWSYIQKVNRISVTVLDNWGNGGANFTRTIPFDKCFSIMSAAEVQAAREAGRLVETSCKTGFGLLGDDTATKAAASMAVVHEMNHQEAIAKKQSEAAPFQALKETLKAGVQVVSAPQLFPTPPELAARMVELARAEDGNRILEPSAGTGNIAAQIARNTRASLLCVEINRELANLLARLYPTTCADFLACNGDLGKFDRVVMNPPFEHGSDIKHIKHALTFLNPGGRLVAICANGPRQQEELQPLADSWEELPEGTFSEQGTNVRTILLTMSA